MSQFSVSDSCLVNGSLVASYVSLSLCGSTSWISFWMCHHCKEERFICQEEWNSPNLLYERCEADSCGQEDVHFFWWHDQEFQGSCPGRLLRCMVSPIYSIGMFWHLSQFTFCKAPCPSVVEIAPLTYCRTSVRSAGFPCPQGLQMKLCHGVAEVSISMCSAICLWACLTLML